MDKLKIFFALVLIVLSVFFLSTKLQAESKDPWFNRKILVPEDRGCAAVPFDGGAKPLSKMYLSFFSDLPVYVVIYNGSRYIRENINARQRVVINFVNANGFSIEVCRNTFRIYEAALKDASDASAAGNEQPRQVVDATQAPANLARVNKAAFAVWVNSN